MNAQVQKELIALKGKRDLLAPKTVVSWARKNKTSALHKEFQWNVDRAAMEHWLSTARRLIALHIVYEDGTRKFVSLSIDRRPGGGYRDVGDVVAVPDFFRVMLSDALKELSRVRSRYERVEELRPVWMEVDRITRATKPRPDATSTASPAA